MMSILRRWVPVLLVMLVLLLIGAVAHAEEAAVIPSDGSVHSFVLDDPSGIYPLRLEVGQAGLVTVEIVAQTDRMCDLEFKTTGVRNATQKILRGQSRLAFTQFMSQGAQPMQFRMWKPGDSVAFTVKMTVQPKGVTELEPNDTAEQAQPLAEKQVVRGVLGHEETDLYRIVLAQDAELAFCLKQSRHLVRNFSIRKPDGTEVERLYVGHETRINKPHSFKTRFSLPAGEYLLRMYGSDMLYDLSWKPVGLPRPTLDLLVSIDGGHAGSTATFGYVAKPDLISWPAPSYRSSNPKVASVDAQGNVLYVSAGKCRIFVTVGATTKSRQFKVKANNFSRAKPLVDKRSKTLQPSHKRLYAKGDTTYAEVFIYNNTGKNVRTVTDLVGVLYDIDYEKIVYAVQIGDWSPKGGIPPRGYKVLKFSYPSNGNAIWLGDKQTWALAVSYPTDAPAQAQAQPKQRVRLPMQTLQ